MILLPLPTSTLIVPSCVVCVWFVWFVVPPGWVKSVVVVVVLVVAEIAGPVVKNTKRAMANDAT